MLFKRPLYLTEMTTDTYLVGKVHTFMLNLLLTSLTDEPKLRCC